MNESTAHFSKTLDDFKQQLAAKLTEARKILAVINALEETLGLPKTAPSELAAGVSIQDPVAPPKPAENSIRRVPWRITPRCGEEVSSSRAQSGSS